MCIGGINGCPKSNTSLYAIYLNTNQVNKIQFLDDTKTLLHVDLQSEHTASHFLFKQL